MKVKKMMNIFDDANYCKAQKKLQDLKQKAAAIENQIEAALQSRTDGAELEAARKMLDGQDPCLPTGTEIETLRAQLGVVNVAIKLAENDELAARMQAGSLLCESRMTEAQAKAARTAKALSELSAAIEDEQQFYGEIECGGAGKQKPAHWVIRPAIRELLRGGYPLSSGNCPLTQCLNEYRQFWDL